jgi:ActR/RegA family two-component response regulator
VDQRGRARILLIADRPSVRREVARLLVEGGLHVQVVSTIAEAISAVVLERPTFVVFDSHLAASEGTHAVSDLLLMLETYRLQAVDFTGHRAADDDGLEGAGQPAPLRPRPPLRSLQAEAELPNESVG